MANIEKSKVQRDLLGHFVNIIEKKVQCPHCHKFLKSFDNRHLIHCSEYKKSLPIKSQNRLNTIESILTSATLALPKDHAKLQLPNGKELDFIFVDGAFVGFLFQLSNVLSENYHTIYRRYKRLSKLELMPNYHGINYQKKITWERLTRDFGTELPVHSFPTGSTLVILREDDMIFLASKSTTSKTSDLITKYLIDYNLKTRNWICDLIYKLGRCNNREFLFLCAWLRLGYALEEIKPQEWFRLPTTIRRVDFLLKDREIVVEIDASDVKYHDPARDKTTDRWFFSKGKIVIRFMNSEIDANPLKCVRETIEIAKQNGIYISQQVLPDFIKHFTTKGGIQIE